MNRKKLASAAPLLSVVVLAAAMHITPTVVLKKKSEVIRQALGDASAFFVKEIPLSKAERKALEKRAGFSRKAREVKFYLGRDDSGALKGVVIFPVINTQHGPIEVGVAFSPEGTITRVVATKATVETKKWVLEAERTGFLADFAGMKPGDDTSRALARVREAGLGKMPSYFAGIIARAVNQGLVVYGDLFEG